MTTTERHRKTIKHFHEPGDVQKSTFSCYRRQPLLTNHAWRTRLSRAIDETCRRLNCHLAAFVYLPEHVHLLVWQLTCKVTSGGC
jgi:putative transposase